MSDGFESEPDTWHDGWVQGSWKPRHEIERNKLERERQARQSALLPLVVSTADEPSAAALEVLDRMQALVSILGDQLCVFVEVASDGTLVSYRKP